MRNADHQYEGLAAIDPAVTMAFSDAVRDYATTLTDNFASLTDAQPEDQLKGPVGGLLKAAGKAAGLSIVSRTEARLDGVAGRPDLGVDSNGLPVGNIELKRPGTGARPEKFTDKHSRDQFERFKRIPNLIYTDGREWALYRFGVRVGDVIFLSNDPTHAGAGGITDEDIVHLLDQLGKFLLWEPTVPSTPRALAIMLAPLTRLLRDEVLADVKAEGVMAQLAAEWRATLFPDADDATFADGYAETFTYALLLARLEGAVAPLNAEVAAKKLDSDHALLAQALRVLGQAGTRDAIGMPVGLIERVISVVDAAKISANKDPWLYFYEDFLAAYDPEQRNDRGVFYTPVTIVSAQVRLCQHLLVDRFGKDDGFGDSKVVVLDPGAGTGTYPLTIAAHALEDAVYRSGEGVRAQVATQLMANINAFEILVGPYAVSHLRLSRAFKDAGAQMPADGVNVFLTDTLATPAHEGFAGQATLFQKRLAAEQERASKVKSADTRVTVVIGNPPYNRDASQVAKGTRRKGGMVRYEGDTDEPGLIKDFLNPLHEAGGGIHAKNLYNDYVYFWRWAIWKICEQHDDPGIASFITASSYLTGPGFAGMREVMRRRFDEIWILDLGGDGRGTRRDDNVFEGVLSPVAIALAVRRPGGDLSVREQTPAVVRYRTITGDRAEKFAALDNLSSLDPELWQEAPTGWGENFQPTGTAAFNGWPLLFDLMPWRPPGSQFKRSWPIGEDLEVLRRRWETLLSAPSGERPNLLRETGDRQVNKRQRGLMADIELQPLAQMSAMQPPEAYSRYGYRSFDRQWCISDMRVADRPRPELWRTASAHQIYLVTLPKPPLGSGPAVTATSLMPDNDHFRGSYSGSVMPLWRDRSAEVPNITSGVLELLGSAYEKTISAEEVVAYIYALLGTGAYSKQFSDELATSAPRVPFTSDADLFGEVATFGKDLLWWATFGDRFRPVDAKGKTVKRLPPGTAKNTKSVPGTTEGYPEAFSYDSETHTIYVGKGEFGPIDAQVWEFEVSGLKVVQSWLGYRMRKRSGKKSSELDNIRPDSWTFSVEFVELLSVIEHFVAATTVAGELLLRVLKDTLIDSTTFPAPTDAERKPLPATEKDQAESGIVKLPLGETNAILG